MTWATCMPILVFLGLSVIELFPMYATDRRQTDVRQKHPLMPLPMGRGIIMRSWQTLQSLMKQLAKLVCNLSASGYTHERIFRSSFSGNIWRHSGTLPVHRSGPAYCVYSICRKAIYRHRSRRYLNLYEVSLLVQQLNTLVNMQDAAIFLYM